MNNLVTKRQLFQLILVQFRGFYREPGVLFWAIGFPILMAWGLGIAFKASPEIVRKVAIIENSAVQGSGQDILARFLERQTRKIVPGKDGMIRYVKVLEDKKLGKTTYEFISTDWKNAILLLKRGKVSLILKDEGGRVTYHFDPANPEARLVQLQVEAMISGSSGPGSQDVIPMTLSGTRYIDFLIPGLITMGIMMSCMWGLSYGIIDKRSKKLLRRMVATPMRKSYFLIALITVRVGMNFVESFLLFLFAALVFNITIQGNIAALIIIFLAGNIAFAGIAIFISSHTGNTEIGNGLINVVVLPMMVLSGIFFSYHNFPDWSIPFIKLIPLTMLADGIRSIFIEGAGFAQNTVPTIILLAIGVFFFSTGLKLFKWH